MFEKNMKKILVFICCLLLVGVKLNAQTNALFAWGYNGEGQLGDGTTTNKKSPTLTKVATNWKSISSGLSHSMAINSSGELYAWGGNRYGQLGDGNTSNAFRKSPVRVGTATWTSVSCNKYQSIAINSSGELWAWGHNASGQLGDGTTTTPILSPKLIGTSTNWTYVSCGQNHSMAINSSGELWTWGSNAQGQLGDGTNNDTLSPKRIGTATNWISISAGANHSLAINSSGQLYAWGYNGVGQLGMSTGNMTSPTRIGTATDWESISCGVNNTMAINSSGELYVWGDNSYGQLGTGNTTNLSTPTRIGTSINWKFISTGVVHSMAITTSGELYTWGVNSDGELGDGTLTNTNSPNRVGTATNWVLPGSNSWSYHSIAMRKLHEWTGTADISSTSNWSNGSVPSSSDTVIILSGSLTVNQTTSLDVLTITGGATVKLTAPLTLRNLYITYGTLDLNGQRLTVTGKITQTTSASNYYIQAGTLASPKTRSELVIKPTINKNSTIYLNPDANKINLFEVGNSTYTAQITLGNALKIKGGEDGSLAPGLVTVNKKGKIIIPSGSSLTLECDTFNAQLSLGATAQKSIVCTGTGKFNIERDHYGVRGWRLYSHPFAADIDLQEVANDIELIGAGGTSEGFYSDNYKNGAAYWYDYTKADSTAATDPAWTAFTSAKGTTVSGNANKWKKNNTMLLFNPGNQRGTDAFGSPSTATYVQGKITLSYALDSVTAIQLNDGKTQTNTTGTLPSKSKYFFITNPYTAPIKLCRIHGLNSTNVDPYFYYWKQRRNTVTNNFSPAEWQAEKIFNGTALRDSNIAIPAFGTILVRLKNSGSTTFTIHEAAKQLTNYSYIIGGAKSVSKTGLMFVDATGSDIGTNGVEIKLLVNDSQEADRVLVYNEANQSPTYTTYDAAKYTNTDFPNIYTLSADAKPLAIDMQDIKAQLDAGKTEVVIPITIKREANKRYASLKMELSANTTGMEISLKDNQSKSVEPWFTGNLKSVQFAATDAEINRYSLVFKQNTTSVKDLLKDIASNKNNASKSELTVYPNPTDGKLSLKLSNGDNYQGNYQIFDMTGRLLMEGKSQKTQIDASKLSSGQYIIKTKSQVSIFNKN